MCSSDLEHLACHECGTSFEELEPRSFSFNSPFGACPACAGLGVKLEADAELLVPDESKSLKNGAIAPWAGGHVSTYFDRLVESIADELGISMDTPWVKLPSRAKKALLYGHEEEIHIRYRNRYGRQRSYWTTYEGVVTYV